MPPGPCPCSLKTVSLLLMQIKGKEEPEELEKEHAIHSTLERVSKEE